MIDGVLYYTTPGSAFALDARTGRQLWQYAWQVKGGHGGNRGLAALGDTLYMETPDCRLIAINMKDGKAKWNTTICDVDLFYYASVAPTVVRDLVIVGVSGDDLDMPGYLQAHDIKSGELRWRWYTVPQKNGDPGSETWGDETVMRHGGGMTWQPITYDPELDLIYVTTGNVQPVMAGKTRPGSNLFTGCIVALHSSTGKMAWYFQTNPRDTHDWDATQVAVLFDDQVDGQPRKLLAKAARNGHFFVLDRTNGKALLSKEFIKTNWHLGYDEKGQPIVNPAKEPQISGALVAPDQFCGTNANTPTYSPQTGLFYVSAMRSWAVYYIYDPSNEPAGWSGVDRRGVTESMLMAIDYKTGNIKWSRPRWEGGRTNLMSTAGNLLFSGGAGGLQAHDARTGEPLWHSRIGAVSNAPVTYELDGLQYVVAGTSTSIAAFVLNR
jgi:alcohol dehydrogenase (cytochrome c)